MAIIQLQDLKDFCRAALMREGMKADYAGIVAEVLAETDAFGTYSHGTKNLHSYIKKARAGGLDLHGKPELVTEGSAYAVYDAHRTMGMIPSYLAMEKAMEKAEKTGIAIAAVKNSCHFGAAGYYTNMAALCTGRQKFISFLLRVDRSDRQRFYRRLEIENRP